MILNKLTVKEAEALATERDFDVESDQNGVKRIVIDGVIVEGGRYGGNLELSIAAVPKNVKKYRLTTAVKTKAGPLDVIVGDFEHSYEAADYASEANLPENNYKVSEVEVEVEEVAG